jgi:nucleobase transporter 1/2
VKYIVKNELHVFLGSDDLDQVLRVLLGTAMFVGGVLGFILDNTVPGIDCLFSS